MGRANSKYFNRRGQFGTDLLVWILALFVLAIILIAGNNINTEITDELKVDPDMSNRSVTMLTEQQAAYPTWGDNVFIMVLMLFWGFLLVTSFFINTNPMYFFISIVLLVAVLIVGSIISNTYTDIADDETMSTFADDFPKTNWVMENLLLVLMVIGMSTGIALYAKGRTG